MKSEIEEAYRSSGNALGWRLLASPEVTLTNASVAFIGLNPGGSTIPEDHPSFSMPIGKSAYVDESWGGHLAGNSPLQRQVRALFQRLGVKPEAVLAGNLVPFRSPDWASLRNRQASLAFGKALWSRILQTASPNLIVTMGGEATDALTDILGISTMNRFPVGWGNITARRGSSDGGTLIGLPHLSRFGVMTRSQSSPYLDTLFDGAV